VTLVEFSNALEMYQCCSRTLYVYQGQIFESIRWLDLQGVEVLSQVAIPFTLSVQGIRAPHCQKRECFARLEMQPYSV
jgi:hypothetical protein